MNNEIEQLDEQTVQLKDEELSWLQQEQQTLNENKHDGDYPDPLQFEEGKITAFTVDFSEPFKKWEDDGTVKRIIPVTDAEGIKKVIWLNVKNPLYKELVDAGVSGKTEFKVLRTGQKKETRYTLVKD